MTRRSLALAGFLLVAGAGLLLGTATAQGPLDRPVAWADCEVYQSLVTPAQFRPDAGNFDELYMNPHGYRDGIPLISDSKPGDRDYNGGRWHLNVLKESVDPSKYADACSFEDLDPMDFMSTDDYFECPLQPRRGRGHGRN